MGEVERFRCSTPDQTSVSPLQGEGRGFEILSAHEIIL